MDEIDVEYAGFWVRVGATIIDTLLLMIISYPIFHIRLGVSSF
jgi:hypothetical protein